MYSWHSALRASTRQGCAFSSIKALLSSTLTESNHPGDESFAPLGAASCPSSTPGYCRLNSCRHQVDNLALDAHRSINHRASFPKGNPVHCVRARRQTGGKQEIPHRWSRPRPSVAATMMMMMIDTIQIRGPTMLRRRSWHCKKEKPKAAAVARCFGLGFFFA